jgi:hypothetical protein
MALTAAQKVTIQEITRESLTDVSDAAADLTAEQETVIAGDIATWASGSTPLRNSFVRLKGGSSGVDFDGGRKRREIFYRVREMLGFEEISYDRDVDGDVLSLVELETGVNFG